ncbi:carboxypeptidase-like regulatory domain-containing protein [Hymenobacter sp. 5516J-16]|uniref:carboxypeptidase-like regulatory domain-containing protein n=1 Tax=Hymenobacter sp. 5516J-16 TaxID=2932253 RepID=UPI001FD58292|nr:carboxypeptidase-like regulatory domain-containing protein [Hymenobacter sp. 5516J-16]UOQ76969.1 carboxypeptidase-like regulatory domain-containing protein [Hymenobacter sp. 5516J-16]
MNAKTPTPVEHDELMPDLNHEEDELSSGNGRLAIIVGIIVAVVVLGYVLLPAQATRRIANAMPIMELGEASVTGHREKEAAPATEEEATTETEANAEAATKKAASRSATATPETAAATTLAAPGTEAAAEPVAIEPVPAAPAAPEAAPATVTLSGRILDEEGQPLAGATVMLKGSRKVAGTDANGNYSIEVPAGDNTLVYGYGGYEDHEVHARNGQPQNVTLVPREDAPRRRRR